MLEKQALERKKQALNEEKNLINERVNYRKKMMDQETKDEELAELKRQYNLISADTTRTKEANELRRKINEMEKQQAQQAAEDIAAAEIKSIEDRQQALTDYEAVREEDLNNYLSDARNFGEELDTLINGSFEDFVAWNAKYNETYIKATDEQRKQMEQGWEDTWDNMLGLLKLYWEEADEASRSKEGWMALATSTDSFKSLSEPEQARQLQVLSDQYDAMLKAQIDNATFDDTHEILNTIQELKDWTFNVNVIGLEDYLVNSKYSTYDWHRNTADGPLPTVNEYEGWGKVYVPEPTYTAPAETSTSSGTTPAPAPKKTTTYYVDNLITGQQTSYKTKEEAMKYAKSLPGGAVVYDKDKKYYDSYPGYAEGGLVDFTGPAIVHGTKSRPEAFLDADDTAILRNMLDAFNYVRINPYMSHIDDKHYQGTNISVGDVNVNLYEAQLKDDADYDEVARKVGASFTKELQKNGLNLAGYAW